MLEKLPEAVGEALEGVRAGLDKTLQHAVGLRQGLSAMTLASLAFADHAPLPAKYTADGEGLSPPLHWQDVPAGAAEVVLIVEDADSPTPMPLVHAIAHRLAVCVRAEGVTGVAAGGYGALAEGAMNPGAGDGAEPLVAMGHNSLALARWLPPDPPPGHGLHRYVFQVFALGPGEPLSERPGRDAVRQAVRARGLASGCLVGTYERPSTAIADPLAEPLRPAVS